VLLPAVLNVNPVFVSEIGSFNVVAIYPFLIVGTAEVLARLAGLPVQASNPRGAHRSRSDRPSGRLSVRPLRVPVRLRPLRVPVVAGVTIVMVVVLAFLGVSKDRQLPDQWEFVNVPASQSLSHVLNATPRNAEVIASQGVVGRFGGRQYVYAVMLNAQWFPVQTGEVEFVLTPSQGIETASVSALQADVTYVETRLHASLVADDNGVYAFLWRPSARTRYVILPGTV
jgi:hypothetical protein